MTNSKFVNWNAIRRRLASKRALTQARHSYSDQGVNWITMTPEARTTKRAQAYHSKENQADWTNMTPEEKRAGRIEIILSSSPENKADLENGKLTLGKEDELCHAPLSQAELAIYGPRLMQNIGGYQLEGYTESLSQPRTPQFDRAIKSLQAQEKMYQEASINGSGRFIGKDASELTKRLSLIKAVLDLYDPERNQRNIPVENIPEGNDITHDTPSLEAVAREQENGSRKFYNAFVGNGYNKEADTLSIGHNDKGSSLTTSTPFVGRYIAILDKMGVGFKAGLRAKKFGAALYDQAVEMVLDFANRENLIGSTRGKQLYQDVTNLVGEDAQ